MNKQYPIFTKTDEKDPEIWKPRGWIGRFYKLFSNLQFTRKELRLSEDLCVIQTDLRHGHIKISGLIDPGRLTISFYDGSDHTKLSGKSVDASKMVISYNGCRWDAASKSPASSFVVNFSENLSEQIVSKQGHEFLMGAAHNRSGERISIVSASTPSGDKLKHAIKSCIKFTENDQESEKVEGLSNWMSEDLISLASCLISEVSGEDIDVATRGEASRYSLASNIEKLLWIDPANEEAGSLTLDGIASRFKCSRRQIQASILEHYGIGFVELKRSIRLYQAHEKIKDMSSYKNISSVACAYEFDHLSRFSQYYKEMFGILPSKHLQKVRRDLSE